jgi:RNA polymerase sigma factor (sigma-70 family)
VGTGRPSPVIQFVRDLAAADLGGLSDGQLLARFVGRRDEAAFAALVQRHGPLVLGVCRHLLRHEHDAHDAFQATWLVLVRKAGGLTGAEGISPWLYAVARRVARRAQLQAARRRSREGPCVDAPAVEAGPDAERKELQAVLHEELGALPEKYRAPLVLCHLEGRTNEEAARRLRWPVGTVKTRLARGREQLRARLARRGLALPAALAAVALSRGEAPAALVQSTVGAVARFASGRGMASAKVVALAEGAMRMMFLSKLKGAAALLLAVGLIGFGTAMITHSAPAPVPGEPKGAGRGPAAPKKGDREMLQGAWKVVEVEANGVLTKQELSKDQRWLIAGERITVEYGDGLGDVIDYRLDPGQKPKVLELTFASRPFHKVTFHGVYELAGDRLKVRYTKNVGQRSVDFRVDRITDRGSIRFVLQREPKGAEKEPGIKEPPKEAEKEPGIKEPPRKLRERLGRDTVAILRGATRVEVFRVDAKDYLPPGKGDPGKAEPGKAEPGKAKRFGGYAVTGVGPAQGRPFAAKAARVLLDGGNFELERAKGCLFQPGVGLRFWKGEQAAELLLCFGCSELLVVAPDPKAQGVKIPYADFGPGRPAVVRLVQEALPGDKVIGALKEKEE